jgi:hypothetical protein
VERSEQGMEAARSSVEAANARVRDLQSEIDNNSGGYGQGQEGAVQNGALGSCGFGTLGRVLDVLYMVVTVPLLFRKL